MNKKHNFGAHLVAWVLLVIILALIFIGCYAETAEPAEIEKTQNRFVVELDEYHDRTSFLIITDTETGAQYLLIRDYYGASGLTALQIEED